MKPKSIWTVVLEAITAILLAYFILPIVLSITPYFFFGLDQSMSFYVYATYIVWLRIAIEYLIDLISEAWHGKKHNR